MWLEGKDDIAMKIFIGSIMLINLKNGGNSDYAVKKDGLINLQILGAAAVLEILCFEDASTRSTNQKW